jgi:bifunctional UDP-N-acetylglucosamine pyrophosphorylase/glucosamine-1-phosphate N-acetyltransferase
VILAAGKGTRMRAKTPKAAVPVAGRPMAARVADAIRGAGISRIIAVVGHRASDVKAALGDGVEFVVQDKQLGTGHAARCAQAALADHEGPMLLAYADIPLLTKDDVSRLVEQHLLSGAVATILTAVLPSPGTLGRILRNGDGTVKAIVEARDATEEQLKTNEVNVGVYCFEAPAIFDVLRELRPDNAQAQYYLTDVIGMFLVRGQRVDAIALQVPDNGMGVNTIEDLARAQQLSSRSAAPG